MKPRGDGSPTYKFCCYVYNWFSNFIKLFLRKLSDHSFRPFLSSEAPTKKIFQRKVAVTYDRFVVSTRSENRMRHTLQKREIKSGPRASKVKLFYLSASQIWKSLEQTLEVFRVETNPQRDTARKRAHSRKFCQFMEWNRVFETRPLAVLFFLVEGEGGRVSRKRIRCLSLKQFHGDFWCWIFILFVGCYSFLTGADFLTEEMRKVFLPIRQWILRIMFLYERDLKFQKKITFQYSAVVVFWLRWKLSTILKSWLNIWIEWWSR